MSEGFGLLNDGYAVWPDPNQGTVTVGLVDSLLLAENRKRLGVYFTNNGANDAWVTFKIAAELVKGFPLRAGATLSFEIDKENQLWMQGEVRAITSVGAVDVAYYESVVP